MIGRYKHFSYVIGHDGEYAIRRDDRHYSDSEVVHRGLWFIVPADKHGVEKTGEDDGD